LEGRDKERARLFTRIFFSSPVRFQRACMPGESARQKLYSLLVPGTYARLNPECLRISHTCQYSRAHSRCANFESSRRTNTFHLVVS
jgi:hypothetical protein